MIYSIYILTINHNVFMEKHQYFKVAIIGSKGCGKTTFIEHLKKCELSKRYWPLWKTNPNKFTLNPNKEIELIEVCLKK